MGGLKRGIIGGPGGPIESIGRGGNIGGPGNIGSSKSKSGPSKKGGGIIGSSINGCGGSSMKGWGGPIGGPSGIGQSLIKCPTPPHLKHVRSIRRLGACGTTEEASESKDSMGRAVGVGRGCSAIGKETGAGAGDLTGFCSAGVGREGGNGGRGAMAGNSGLRAEPSPPLSDC